MKKIYRIIVLFVMANLIANAQVTVNGGPTLTYTSLNTAFAAINAGTHFGAITIDITGNTVEGVTGYAPTPLLASGQSLANYSSIVIRPTVQATVSGSPATGRGVIELDGADNVTIDGDIVAGPVQKDLTFNHTGLNSLAATAVIRFIGRTTLGLGATNNTITNCVIIGNTVGNDGISGSTVVNSYGIYFGANALALTTGGLGDNYDNNVISNNEIKKAYFGIWLGGTTANPADNNLISGNTIGSNTTGETVSFGGISLSSVATSTITQNEIFNLKLNTSVNNFGIQIAGTSSASVTISRNKIYGIHSLSTSGYGAYGINLTAGNGHLVVNNVIYDLMTTNYSSTSTTWNAFGIRITSGTGIGVYYNSVNLYGQINVGSNTSVGSAAFLVSSTVVTGLDVRNNIFNNTQTSTVTTVTTKKFMSVWFPSAYNFSGVTLDNNAYTVTNDADHFVGKVGTTNNVTEAANLPAWQAFSQVNNALNDVNSGPIFNFPAPFTSNTNLTFPANTNFVAESGAVLIPALGTNIDYNANVRPLAGINPNTAPDMGAYEFDGLNGFPTDAGINLLVSPPTGGCYSASENVVARIKNFGTTAINNIPVTVIVSGPINQTLTGTYAGPIVAGGTFDYTLTPTINMLGAGVYNFKSFTSLTGDGQALNDTLANITRTVMAAVSVPQQVDFTGFTGANLPTVFSNWREGQGAVPNGTVSNWTSQSNFPLTGNTNARIYLSAAAANEWIVGPKLVATANTALSFDAGITGNVTAPFTSSVMGSDDKVMVMVSTDCGLSYTPIFTVNASNNLGNTFTNFNIPLGSYAGQDIIVAFLATDGPIDNIEAYYFHLDNINIYLSSPTDAGVSAVVTPSTGCFTNNEQVVVTITNFGTSNITNIPVTMWVSGPLAQTINATYTGTIVPAATANFTVGTINLAAAGTYTLKSFTTLAGDLNAINDSNTVQKTTLPLGTLPQFVSFTGFTGANLPTVFPDWREGQGATVPNGTTSNWLSQTGLNGPTNITARINMYTTIRNEWIVGPKVLASSNTNLSFDAAVTDWNSIVNPDAMGSDDKVRVMVSTDCGITFTPIFTVSAANNLGMSFTNFNIPLGAYAGQEIIVAFLAQDGPIDDVEDYDFHLDNINLYNSSPTDAGVSAITSPSVGCFSNAEPVVVNVTNIGTAAISNFPVTAWISGSLTQTLTGTYTANLAPSASANFTLGTINMSAAGNYTIKGFTSLTGDTNNNNDSTSVVKTTLPLAGLPQSVSFTGFTGANLPTVFSGWNEATGAIVPTGTTSSWINQAGLNGASNTNARIYLSATANNVWIVGPKVLATANTNVAFDVAITGNVTAPFSSTVMGSDDKLRVMVSTDCGNSFAPVFTVSASNNLGTAFTNFNVNLGAYAGQEIMVAFLAQDGPIDDIEAYYLHLDNINLYNAAAADGGVSAILSPTVNACLSATEQIVVTVNNYGFNPLTNFPVTAVISGPINSTVTSNYTGTLAPNTSASYTIGTANMNVSGAYTVNAFTGVAGDPNAFNDATTLVTTQTPNFGIAGVNLICGSGSTTLNVTGSASTYTWSNNSNSASIVVSPSVTTTYSAAATGGTNNCQVSAFFTVTVTNPTISTTGAAICGTTAVGTLSANAFGPVSWYSSPTSTVVLATGNTFTATAPVTTTYYAEAMTTSNGSLQTTFAAGNGCGGGAMFDVTPLNGAINIDSLDINTSVAANTTLSVIIYYKTGTYLGNETNAAVWTAWDTIVATSAGANQPTRVPFNNALNIPNSVLTGLYVNYNAQYTNGTSAFSNLDLTVQTGAGLCSQFGGVNAGRMFNGNIYYTKPGCTSPKVPVTLTVNPTPNVAINASTTTICSGNTVTLTASGADTYTWSTSSTNATIVESPSVTTTYTLNGTSIACNTTGTSTVTINVNQTPSVTLVAGASTICAMNGSISLTGSPAGGVYSGASITGSLLSIANPGTFVPVYSYTNSLNGCSNSASTTVIVANCTSIDNNGAITSSTISVYPNPNNGSFTIETGNELSKEIAILDLTGRVVFSEITEAKKIQLNIENLANGMYHVIVKTELGSDIIKVIKQ